MIDTTTIRRTPARSPACCWGEGPVAVSMTHSTPSRAAARPSPVTTSTPLERDIATTSWPPALRMWATWRPTLPVAPATAILRCACMLPLLEESQCPCRSHRSGLIRHCYVYDGARQRHVTDADE